MNGHLHGNSSIFNVLLIHGISDDDEILTGVTSLSKEIMENQLQFDFINFVLNWKLKC